MEIAQECLKGTGAQKELDVRLGGVSASGSVRGIDEALKSYTRGAQRVEGQRFIVR